MTNKQLLLNILRTEYGVLGKIYLNRYDLKAIYVATQKGTTTGFTKWGARQAWLTYHNLPLSYKGPQLTAFNSAWKHLWEKFYFCSTNYGNPVLFLISTRNSPSADRRKGQPLPKGVKNIAVRRGPLDRRNA